MSQRIFYLGCVLCLVILTGCASGVSRENVSLSDYDQDGVVGQLDRCPGTPEGMAVDSNGCAADTDGDGVFDAFDRCPATTVSQGVDLHG